MGMFTFCSKATHEEDVSQLVSSLRYHNLSCTLTDGSGSVIDVLLIAYDRERMDDGAHQEYRTREE